MPDYKQVGGRRSTYDLIIVRCRRFDPIPDEEIGPYLPCVSATAHRQLVKGWKRVIEGMVLRLP
jgi:hypothetical protein